jgi:hypothetical protein
VGFDNLTTEGLRRVISKYAAGLARIEAGEARNACGGTARQVRRWLKLAEAELAARVEA